MDALDQTLVRAWSSVDERGETTTTTNLAAEMLRRGTRMEREAILRRLTEMYASGQLPVGVCGDEVENNR